MRAALLIIGLIVFGAPVTGAGSLPAQLEARIEEIYQQRLYDISPAAVRWDDGGASYMRQELGQNGTPQVVRCTPDNDACEVILSLRELKAKMQAVEPGLRTVNGYVFSRDGRWVLAGGDFVKTQADANALDLFLYDRRSATAKKIARGVTLAELSTVFSPDGRWVLFGRDHDLLVYDTANGTTRRLTFDGVPGSVGNGIADGSYSFVVWSPDSSNIAFLHTDARKVGQFPLIDNTSAVYPKVRMTRHTKVGTPIPTQRLGVVRPLGGRVRWIDIPGRPGTFYIYPPRWSRDGKRLVLEIIARASNIVDLVLAAAATGKSRMIRHEESTTWLRSGFAQDGGFEWIDEGGQFLWISEADGWRRAYKIEGTTVTPITPPGVDVLGSTKIDAAGGWLYYAASPENATQRYLYRARLDGTGAAQRITPANQAGWHTYGIAPNAKWAFHTYSTADRPPTTELIELSTHRALRVLEDNARLKERFAAWSPAPTEFFTIDIGNGVVMDAWMLRPRDFDARKRYPVLVFVYGEPSSQAVIDSWWNGQGNGLFHRAIADAGYLVVAMDNRGTPAPKGRDWRHVVFGSLGPLSTEEQAAGLAELGRMRPYVDLSRVAIWGWSAGGTNTLNALFRKPDQYHVGIAVAAKPRPDLYNGPFQETFMRTPEVNPDGYRDAAPINFAEGLKGDLLIIHGTGEDNTHLQIIEHLVNRLIELGKPFDYMTYPGRRHGINEGPGTTLHLRKLMARYLTDHLQPGGR